jgi:signal transduction histidine kinase
MTGIERNAGRLARLLAGRQDRARADSVHPAVPLWRGLTLQLLAVVVLPLTLLLLIIAFGSYSLHQRDMRALVGERDQRAAQSAAVALESELHHRMAGISNLAAYADLSTGLTYPVLLAASRELPTDFDGGLAFLDPRGHVLASTGEQKLWDQVGSKTTGLHLASAANPGPLLSDAVIESRTQRRFVIISAYSAARGTLAVGAFSPSSLAAQSLSASYPAGSNVSIYLLDPTRQVLFAATGLSGPDLAATHPGIAEALGGQTGTVYVQSGNTEHVIAYSPVALTGWALITEEGWQSVVSPSLRATQMAPLVLVPAFLLALLALWFGVRRIVQPLQRLESEAAALAWGDFDAIQQPVGGISEVQHLQTELMEMARKVQAAQDGLHDYIGAITSAQEEERTRLARELHDDTIQAVIALRQRVQLAQKFVKSHAGLEALHELEALAGQTVENLRRLTRALRPIYLEDLGLVTALEMLVRETGEPNQLEIEFRRSGPEHRLSRETELALYRIAQEALNNVVRHAQAKHASVHIAFDKGVKLEVADDGMGFRVPSSPTEFASSGHFGLLGMRERAELIGARLEVQSEARRGTRLVVRLASSLYAARKETRK